MNKILSSFMLVIACVCMVSCSDNSNDWYETSDNFVLSLEKSDILFDASAAQGFIEVNCDGALTAASSEEWCAVSVSGNKVNVNVENNPNFEGRSAVVTLTSGKRQAKATVQQKGLVFVLDVEGGYSYEFDNEARTLKASVEHTLPVSVKSNNDWLTASFDEVNNVLSIAIAENTTGWLREGSISLVSAGVTRDITISQFDLMSAILGEYDFYYWDANGKLQAPLPAMVTETSLVLNFNNNIWTIPLTIDEETGKLTAGPCGCYIGNYGASYFLYLMWGKGTTWSGYKNTTSVSTADFEFEEDGDEVYIDYYFGGTFGTSEIEYWNFQALKVQEFAEANSAGYLLRTYSPVIEKVIDRSGSASAKSLSKSKKVSSRLSPYIAR